MTFKFALKAGCAAVALVAGGLAHASPFYLDNGINFGGIAPDGVNGKQCATCTAVKNEMQFVYQSSTTIIDSDNSLSISAGDALSTNGGLAVGGFNATGLSNNAITNLLPIQVILANSSNGYGINHFLSFSTTGLTGVVTGVTGTGVPLFQYGPGLVEMYYTTDGISFNNFMDVVISGGGATGVSTVLVGAADFTNVDAGPLNNLFHSTSANCAGNDSFFAIWGCGGGGPVISFNASFDTNIFVSDFAFAPGNPGVFTVTSDHDGSATFNVPEPGSLALLGLGLVGLAAARRRKSA